MPEGYASFWTQFTVNQSDKMTCEQFSNMLENSNPRDVTRAEFAAFFSHSLKCQSCRKILLEYDDGRMGSVEDAPPGILGDSEAMEIMQQAVDENRTAAVEIVKGKE